MRAHGHAHPGIFPRKTTSTRIQKERGHSNGIYYTCGRIYFAALRGYDHHENAEARFLQSSSLPRHARVSSFPEDFQAWKGGPVSPALFNQHRGKFIIRKGELDSTITADEAQIVNEVVDLLAQLSGNQLSARTHSEDPWKNMREGLSPIEFGDRLISKESLQSYYTQHPVLG
ncbi:MULTISPECIES: Panacea domain-containing protein [Actinotignum]|uniref:Panacea domain-containing protein n=1 Tax=Actinotignum TaxID=1653174 RepID=UPI0025505689|nr:MULTISPECIES: type II toxin-antitoxin system antitoxin SocA domain-containing protein [Actinotignum]MDE1535975.1 DUF4065 domain-containing protein [Actinotignum schaalii]MDY5130203.1 DUF4065 domain-containing protein [Actinotignum timonense]MDY5144346.1 DUF4065 domain-containing protein [Actinotignum timonense]